MQRTRLRALVALTVTSFGLAGASLVGGTAAAQPHAKPAPRPHGNPHLVTGHLLAINDFHGNIDPPTGSSGTVNGVPAGGVEYLATYVKKLRAEAEKDSPYVYTVGAGDLVGASPLVSAAFHDEPVVEEMNSLGLDITSVGNHEFDEGVDELKRLKNGGCHPVDGCLDGDGFAGADYDILAANVVDKKTGEPIFPAYSIRKVGHTKVGFVGMTLEGTPGIVNPAGIKDVTFLDEARTANKYARILKKKEGVKTIVLLLHEGGAQNPTTSGINGCTGFSGPLVDIVANLDERYDAVISGHTHQWYNCLLPDSSGEQTRVTSAGSFGRLVTDMKVTVNDKAHKIVSATANNVIVDNGVKDSNGTYQLDADKNFVRNTSLIDAAARAIADKYRAAVAPIANAVVGSITADISRDAVTPSGENPMGNTIADAQLAYTRSDGAQLALMNPGGVRASLVYGQSSGGEAPGQVTYGEAFTVQPFNNLVTTQTFTGAQIKEVLEQQFAGYEGQTAQKILLPSDGFTYTWSKTAAAGSKVSDIRLDGTPVDPAATYRVTTNDFLANGGDGFTKLTGGTDRTTAPGFDVDALTAYLGDGPVAPAPTDRITVAP
jgi:5'-nucleotidase